MKTEVSRPINKNTFLLVSLTEYLSSTIVRRSTPPSPVNRYLVKITEQVKHVVRRF